MKPVPLALLTLSALLLLPALSLRGAPPAKAAEVARMVKDPAMARAALHEMMKSPETKRMMAKELAKDSDFRRLYAAETGSGAPHQERNPTDHPELFQRKPPATR